MHEPRRTDRVHAVRRAFTLTELLVAVVVLLVIILAVGRIFGTAREVVKNGEATADILQETAAVEQLMRNDLDRISDEGFLVVQCIAVRNDVAGQLLDPTYPADHIFRCDQIAFVADDLAISRQTQTMGAFVEAGIVNGVVTHLGETVPTPQSTSSVLYYGHGIQFPYLPQNLVWPLDAFEPVQPWFRPSLGQGAIDFKRWPPTASVYSYNGTQPPARNWSLARQETLLADDYDSTGDYYMSRRDAGQSYRNAATEIFGNEMRSSRVDVLSGDMARLRDWVRGTDLGTPPPDVAAQRVAETLRQYRPRAEKRPPTLDKSDVLLTTSVLGSNCSSFVVDWTWSEGVGRELDLDPARGLGGAIRGVSHRGGVRPGIGGESGIVTEAAGRMPWFGLGRLDDPDLEFTYGNPNRDVGSATSALADADFYEARVRFHAPIAYDNGNDIFGGGSPPASPFGAGSTTIPRVLQNIEGAGVTDNGGIWVYRAVFGLNGKEPFVRDGENRPVTTAAAGGGDLWPVYRSDYTPWPSALRITATFHDSQGSIEDGRTVQFTIPLPARVQDLPEG